MGIHTKRYIAGLDVLRGFSCILIMLYHYTVRYNNNPLFSIAPTNWNLSISWGCAAVTTFFLLSGFLGAKHIFATKKTMALYLRDRFIRIYPSFFASVLITTIVAYMFYPAAACTPQEVLVNFTMIPQFLGIPYVDGVYWTLQVEWVFYIVTAITTLFSNKAKKIIRLVWLVISICGNIFYEYTNISAINKMNILFASKHVQEFLIGVAIYLIVTKVEIRFAITTLMLAIANHLITQDTPHIIFLIVSGLAIFLVTYYQSDKIFCRWYFRFFSWVGGISYQVYLLHQVIGFIIIYYLQTKGYTSTVYIIIPIVVSLFLGYIVQNFVEKPIQRLCE